MHHRSVLPLLVLVCAAASASAADPGALRRSLAMEAPVFVAPPGGLSRLPLPAEVRAQCRPDFSDLRLLDAQGREVPFIVDVARSTTEPLPQSLEPVLVEAFREEQRPEGAPPLRRESFVLATPERFDPASRWTLVVDTPRRDFVRRVGVTQQRDGADEAALVDGRSIFRLAGSGARTGVELPGLAAGRFTVALEGEDDTYLAPTFRLERRAETTPAARLEVPLVARGENSNGGTTVIHLTRPPGVVPERIRIDTASPTFARAVTVRDVLVTGNTVVIGRGTIRRVDAADPEPDLEIDLAPARGEVLRVEIDDQDSPPLEKAAVTAVLRAVTLVFSLPGSDGPAGTLLFSGGRTRAPRYDLVALARLLDRDAEPARLGPVAPNPGFDDEPLLGFAMRPGAGLDPRVFAYRRSIAVPWSRTGLARLRLEPADVVQAQPSLADLRIVDGEGRQWPYLLERDALVVAEPLEMTRSGPDDREARYTLVPRWRPLRVDGLEIEVDATFVDRPFTVVGRDESGTERPLAGGRLRRAAGTAGPLRIAFADTRLTELTLVVYNGDEAPLRLTGVRALCPLAELYVAAPPGDYALLAGDADAAAPEYEIAGMRATILAAPAVDVVTGPGGPNPGFSRGATTARRIAGGRLLPRAAVWIVLVLAVVVLTGLTMRVVRREGPSSPER
jgi:hypothetical protein